MTKENHGNHLPLGVHHPGCFGCVTLFLFLGLVCTITGIVLNRTSLHILGALFIVTSGMMLIGSIAAVHKRNKLDKERNYRCPDCGALLHAKRTYGCDAKTHMRWDGFGWWCKSCRTLKQINEAKKSDPA